MTTGFFAPFGDSVTFDTKADLRAKLTLIDQPVPKRKKGRRSHHRERWAVVRYLHALGTSDRISFPLRVTKDERPDFFVSEAGSSDPTALGLTEAGTERSQRAATALEKRPAGTFLEGEDSFLEPGERSSHPGYIGDDPEREWAALVLDHVQRKTAALNQPRFQSAARYDLLVYDNTHLLPLADLDAALLQLLENGLFSHRRAVPDPPRQHAHPAGEDSPNPRYGPPA